MPIETKSLEERIAEIDYWYHRIELPGGIITPGWAPLEPEKYHIPQDMTGMRVLDIGAWDGYWSFEAAKRGASRVIAVDNFSDTIGKLVNADRNSKWKSFDLCREALGFNQVIDRRTLDICQPLIDWGFNAVFCFGVLYHIKHPLIALERIYECMIPGSRLYVETAILDQSMSAYSDHIYSSCENAFEFYPGDEYGMNSSNWWVGTLNAWCQLVEGAGFGICSSWRLTEDPGHIAHCRGFLIAEKPA